MCEEYSGAGRWASRRLRGAASLAPLPGTGEGTDACPNASQESPTCSGCASSGQASPPPTRRDERAPAPPTDPRLQLSDSTSARSSTSSIFVT